MTMTSAPAAHVNHEHMRARAERQVLEMHERLVVWALVAVAALFVYALACRRRRRRRPIDIGDDGDEPLGSIVFTRAVLDALDGGERVERFLHPYRFADDGRGARLRSRAS
jgi:hypothetical protein